MIRNVLTHIGGIEVYGIISVLLFFVFFSGTLLWAFRLKRPHLEAMGRLPLEDGSPVPALPAGNHTHECFRLFPCLEGRRHGCDRHCSRESAPPPRPTPDSAAPRTTPEATPIHP